MSLARKLAVVVLTVLLASTLVTGNILAAAHLTVLDPGFVQNSIEEEGGYGVVQNAAVESASGGVPGYIDDTEPLIRESLDEAYLQNQTERNVNGTYAYLHGQTDTLNLSVEAKPLKENIGQAVEAQIRNATIPELLDQADVNLTEELDFERSAGINQSSLERMSTNESEYDSVKAGFRQHVRERALDRAVNESWAESSDDEKLYLIIEDYNPREYSDAEKERMVADNETEIRTAMRERIEAERGDEIDQQVDENLAEINNTTSADTGNAEGAQAAAIEIRATYVEALTTDMTYDEFQSQLDESKATAAETVGEETRAALDEELPDRISLTSDMDPTAREGLQQAQEGVTWLDRMAIILPLLGLAIVGLIYFVSRSFQTVASSLGFSLLSAGLPIYIALGFLESLVQEAIQNQLVSANPNELEQAGTELVQGIIGQLFGRVAAVSLVFVLAALVVLAVWLALRFDVFGLGDDGRTAAEAAAAADARAMDAADEENGDDGMGEGVDDEAAAAVAIEDGITDAGSAEAVDDTAGAGAETVGDDTDGDAGDVDAGSEDSGTVNTPGDDPASDEN